MQKYVRAQTAARTVPIERRSPILLFESCIARALHEVDGGGILMATLWNVHPKTGAGR